jgi:hypothetical protein
MSLEPEDKDYISQQLGALEERLQARMVTKEELLALRAATKEDMLALEERLTSLVKGEWRQLVGVLQEDFRDKFSLLMERMSDFTLRSEFEAHVNDRSLHLAPSTSGTPASPAGAARKRSGGPRR